MITVMKIYVSSFYNKGEITQRELESVVENNLRSLGTKIVNHSNSEGYWVTV